MSTSAEFVHNRYETAVPIAERVREMLRRCRVLEGPNPGKRLMRAIAVRHYAEDVRYALGMVTVLVDERAETATRTAELLEAHALELAAVREERDSAVNDADEYRQALRQAEDDVVQLTADLERARRG